METYGLEQLGIVNTAAVYRNLTPAQLTEHALRRGEGILSATGALVVKTGKYTGRSANDKFIVDTPAVHDDIAWGKVNRPMEKEKFDAIYRQGRGVSPEHARSIVFDGFAGADPKYTKSFRIVNELASQNLFIHQLLRRPTRGAAGGLYGRTTPSWPPPASSASRRSMAPTARPPSWSTTRRRWWSSAAPSTPARSRSRVFSVMNYILPKQGVFPMHCSANIGNGRRLRRVLRPLRHRQDHPLRRPRPQAHRRRRARLGRRLRL